MTVKKYLKALLELRKTESDNFFHDLKNKHPNQTLFQWIRALSEVSYNSYIFWLINIGLILHYFEVVKSDYGRIIAILLLAYWFGRAIKHIIHYKLISSPDLKFDKNKYLDRKNKTTKLGDKSVLSFEKEKSLKNAAHKDEVIKLSSGVLLLITPMTDAQLISFMGITLGLFFIYFCVEAYAVMNIKWLQQYFLSLKYIQYVRVWHIFILCTIGLLVYNHVMQIYF